MRFARVSGTLIPRDVSGTGRLIVTLDDGRTVTTVRDEAVALLPAPSGEDVVAWTADQFTQETIANELALGGWEVIGQEAERTGTPANTAPATPVYIVRLMTGGAS